MSGYCAEYQDLMQCNSKVTLFFYVLKLFNKNKNYHCVFLEYCLNVILIWMVKNLKLIMCWNWLYTMSWKVIEKSKSTESTILVSYAVCHHFSSLRVITVVIYYTISLTKKASRWLSILNCVKLHLHIFSSYIDLSWVTGNPTNAYF